MVLQNPFDEKEKEEEIVQVEDFSQTPSFVEGDDFQKSKSLAAAQDTLSSQLGDIQNKMAEIQKRRDELGESQKERAQKSRIDLMTADLLDAGNIIAGINTNYGGEKRVERESEQDRAQREMMGLDEELSALEKAKMTGEREEVGLLGQEEQEMAQQEEMQAAQQLQASKSDPNSEMSMEARRTAELVLGQGAIPPDVSATQLEQIYPDILESARYQQKQADTLMKMGLEQEFKASESAKDRALKEKEGEKERAFDLMKFQEQRKNSFQKAAGDIKSNQAISAGFGRRMQQAEQAFDKLAAQGFDRSTIASGLGSILPNFLQTPEMQQQKQAERNFVNATLRRESGAAIAPDEFASAELQYFPRAGDSPEVIAQKKRNREQQVAMMKAEAAGAWDKIKLVEDPEVFDAKVREINLRMKEQGEGEATKEESVLSEFGETSMPRKKFIPGQGMGSSGRRIFGG